MLNFSPKKTVAIPTKRKHVSKTQLSSQGVLQVQMDTYHAANGSAVTMTGEVQVTVGFETGSGPKKSQSFRLKCCVGSTSRNILSATQLVKRGWTMVQSPGETYLWHEKSNTVITDVVLWGRCPLAESQEDNISGRCVEGYLHADGI